MIALLVFLYLVLAPLVYRTSEDPFLTEIKRRYQMIRVSLPSDPRWELIKKTNSIITGTYTKYDGVIGSNVNKGYEIYICMSGQDVNSAMYILIHELAHMTVAEYDHSEKFWKNFGDLKKICIDMGLYQKGGARQYCGETITD